MLNSRSALATQNGIQYVLDRDVDVETKDTRQQAPISWARVLVNTLSSLKIQTSKMPRTVLLSWFLVLTSLWNGVTARVEKRQTDMMQLVPVAMDMVSTGHTNEPQLRTWESFFWGPGSANSIVNLTVYFGSDNQMVISEDRITSLLSSIVCSSSFDMITYTFKDDPSYEEIVKNWDWVNQQAFRSFILTVTENGCQATPDGDGRQAYQVNGITWKDDQRQAILKVQAKTFMDATGASDKSGNSRNKWNMLVDSAGLTTPPPQFPKRGMKRGMKRLVDQSVSINLARDFSGNIAKTSAVSLDCSKCGTQGMLNFRFQYSPSLLSDSTGSVELRALGVGATAQITISASGNVGPIQKNFELGKVPLPGGFTITGIAAFGPTLSIGIGTQLNTLSIAGSATFGVSMNIPDSIARADLFNSNGNALGGGKFIPNFTPIPPNANAQATISGQIGPQVILAIEATLFTVGASAGLVLVAPALIANVQANLNTQGGVCNNPRARVGVNFALDVGAQLDIFAGLDPAAKLPNRKNVFSAQRNLYSTCLAVAKRSEDVLTDVESPELLS
ncbi:hypothetical protein OPT61_g1940 [Boeremia exigua]|uniref:Uncharacterized protein n=1 Tax=Boeremia exigua TaxID=749465 RepID=A0ACC2INA2_9PLEO|nr:hypothetical protein OPT61_g1940 [Boeremia exigua]